MAGGVPVFIPATEETNFIPTNKDIASRVTRRTKAIVITSPSNPNGSVWAIEGITSPDGRVFGKMGHSERKGENLYFNVPGEKDQQIFESGVHYFK